MVAVVARRRCRGRRHRSARAGGLRDRRTRCRIDDESDRRLTKTAIDGGRQAEIATGDRLRRTPAQPPSSSGPAAGRPSPAWPAARADRCGRPVLRASRRRCRTASPDRAPSPVRSPTPAPGRRRDAARPAAAACPQRRRGPARPGSPAGMPDGRPALRSPRRRPHTGRRRRMPVCPRSGRRLRYAMVPTIWPVSVCDASGALRDAEVGHLRVARRREQDVRRLDIAMQDARSVRGGQRRQHLVQNRPHLWLRQRPLGDHIRQRLPGQPLHHDVRRSVCVRRCRERTRCADG